MENGTLPNTGASAVLLFNWVEYSVFSSMLLLSLLIGVYFGWFKSQDTVAEYMLGGKKMSVFPVTMSLIFSHVSGITFLGVPAEVYSYGSQYYSTICCTFTLVFFVNYLYLPVFYELQLNSLYEYLEMRFNRTTRVFTSFIFAVSLVTYIPVVIYVPALAFNQVTGISVHVITPVVSLICVFYTLFGGLKAVVWTDALQSVFTIGSSVYILILGLSKVGGVSEVIRIAVEGQRIEPINWSLDPFERGTFWTYYIGAMFIWAANMAVHPGAVQRFIAVSTIREAKSVMIWTSVGFFFIVNLVMAVGLVLYATYHDCDPVATKMVKKTGQMLPFYVMQVANETPGLTGLFISGVLSAALSTMSAGLNTVSGTIYEDFVQMFLKEKKLSEKKQNIIIKLTTLILGIFCIIMVFVVERMGAIFQMAMSLIGLTTGTLLGVFSLGIFFPRANPKGAMWGSGCSLLIVAVVLFGAEYYKGAGLLKYPGKSTSVSGCASELTHNATSLLLTYRGLSSPTLADDSVPTIFKLSYMYYAALGTISTIIVGLVVSYISEQPETKCLDPKLFSPPVRRFLPHTSNKAGEYHLVNTNLRDRCADDTAVVNNRKREN